MNRERKVLGRQLAREKISDVWQKARLCFSTGMGLEPRAGQIEMMDTIEDALERSRDHVITGAPIVALNAPTGTGKTFGYLVPVLPFVEYERNVKVVIATANKALQAQIYHKDLPHMQSMLPKCEDLRVALPKGKGNFLCLEKIIAYHAAMNPGAEKAPAGATKKKQKKIIPILDGLSDDEKARITNLHSRIRKGHHESDYWAGDFDDLNISDEVKRRMRSLLAADQHTCINRQCNSYKHCLYYKKKAEWMAADVLIANQDWVLTSLVAGSKMIKPEKTIFVIDEAHHLPEKAVHAHENEMTGKRMEELCDFSKLNEEWAQFNELLDNHPNLYSFHKSWNVLGDLITERGGEFGQNWRASTHVVGEEINKILDRLGGNAEQQENAATTVEKDDVAQDTPLYLGMFRIRLMVDMLLAHLTEMVTHLVNEFDSEDFALLNVYNKPLADAIFKFRGQVSYRISSLTQLASVLDDMMRHEAFDPDISPVAKGIKRSKNGWKIHISDTWGDRILPKFLFDRAKAVILTSATITSGQSETKDGFDLYLRKSGLDKYPDVVRKNLASPFEFSKSVFVEVEMKNEPSEYSFNFVKEASDILPSIIKDSGAKGVLLLFTSLKMMNEFRANVPEDMIDNFKFQKDGGLEQMIAQHKLDVNDGKLSIMAGVQSLAEGLDLPGAWCEHVIIARIPFSPPDDPIKKLLQNWYENAVKQNYFRDIARAEAETILLQQIGRLIRTVKDRGIVTVLDARFGAKHKVMRRLIPPGMQHKAITSDQVLESGYQEINKIVRGQDFDPTRLSVPRTATSKKSATKKT